jgi:Xaa-Pro aminopeptidase
MEIPTNRTEKAQRLLAEQDYDLLVLFPSSNMLYLSGFYDEPMERMLLFILPREGSPVFLVPELYEGQVKEESPFPDVRVWKDAEDPRKLLERTLAELAPGATRVLVDDGMWALFLLMLREVLPGAEFALSSRVLNTMRMRKTPDEIRFLEEAGAIADEAFEEVIRRDIEGMTELVLASAIEEAMRDRGADKIAFETLVASGPNGALPHHRAGKRRIEHGDAVILDYGCKVRGYCSDITRTIVCKQATKEVQTVHEIVKSAQEKAVQAAGPGVAARTVDLSAREEIAGKGYGERFIHRTGHGIGLEVHEQPYITESNALELQEGMAFSVEPGIYLPGKFGVRIEDIVVVTQTGAKRLNHCSHALQVVG